MIHFFDAVRIINLAQRADRRQETEAEFAKYGFPIHTDRVQFFKAIAPQTADGFPNPGVRGCFLSHLGVLEAALAAQARHVLVLEDDISFARKIGTLGPAAVQALEQQDWELAYLGHALPDADGEPRWLPVEQPMLLAHCYAVNGRALPELIAYLRAILGREAGHPDGGPMHYDGALNHFRRAHPTLRAVYFSKNLGYQRPSMTNLHQVSVIDRHPLLRPFAPLLRRIKRWFWSRSR